MITGRLLIITVVLSPVAGLDATRACVLTHRHLLPNITLHYAKTWFMSLNAVPVTKCTSEKLGDASLSNLEFRSTRLPDTDLSADI